MLDFKKVFTRFKVNKYFIVLIIAGFVAGYLKEILMLFIFVLLHELCHVISALVFKLEIKSIEIFPFGGVARVDNLNYIGTIKEIIITIAGPLFNLTIAIFLFFLQRSGVNIPDYSYIMEINISLAVFNMLPGIPLDGVRILRAVLGYFAGLRKATRTAIICGKLLAIVLFFCGIFCVLIGNINISLLIVPFFIFVSASREENAFIFMIVKDIIYKKEYMKKRGVMETVQICVLEDVSVREILKYFEFNRYHIITVINNKMKVLALLTESEILDNLILNDDDITFAELCKILKGNKV